MKDIEKQLKQALIDSGMSRAEIVRKSKNQLSEAQLSYFVNNKRSLTLPAAAKLAKILGLELKPKKKRGK
jgi:plasmid maintenance system antidote protein VapI